MIYSVVAMAMTMGIMGAEPEEVEVKTEAEVETEKVEMETEVAECGGPGVTVAHSTHRSEVSSHLRAKIGLAKGSLLSVLVPWDCSKSYSYSFMT